MFQLISIGRHSYLHFPSYIVFMQKDKMSKLKPASTVLLPGPSFIYLMFLQHDIYIYNELQLL